MKRIALGLLAATILSSGAFAADLGLRPSFKAAEMAPVPFTWTGIYVGGNIGSGFGSTTQDLNSVTVGTVTTPLGLPLSSFSENGFIGGGQVGANYQFGGSNIVVGVEAEGDWSNVKGHGPCLVVLTCSTQQKWLADVAGRVGFAMDHTLLYVKGGYAWSKFDSNATLTLGGTSLTASDSATRQGALLGTGIEHAFGGGWSAKLEYDFIDFGSKTADIPIAITAVKTAISANVANEQKEHLVKFGINYRFGAQ